MRRSLTEEEKKLEEIEIEKRGKTKKIRGVGCY